MHPATPGSLRTDRETRRQSKTVIVYPVRDHPMIRNTMQNAQKLIFVSTSYKLQKLSLMYIAQATEARVMAVEF